jgi:DNA invertase Pin-like site-specific DNA recombinase
LHGARGRQKPLESLLSFGGMPDTSSPADELDRHRQALEEMAVVRAEVDRVKADATEELVRRMRAGLGAGLSVSEVARRGGVSRWTVYEWLQERDQQGIAG